MLEVAYRENIYIYIPRLSSELWCNNEETPERHASVTLKKPRNCVLSPCASICQLRAGITFMVQEATKMKRNKIRNSP